MTGGQDDGRPGQGRAGQGRPGENHRDENHRDRGERAVPYVCPFCGEEDLRPVEEGRWHCRSCLRLFTVAFFGLRQPGTAYPPPASAAPPPTPAAGIRLVDPPAAATRGPGRAGPQTPGDHLPDDPDPTEDPDPTDDLDRTDDRTTPGSPR